MWKVFVFFLAGLKSKLILRKAMCLVLRCYAFILPKCSFTSGAPPDEGIVSRYMEQSRWVTVGLISWKWLHNPNQIPPVMTRESQH